MQKLLKIQGPSVTFFSRNNFVSTGLTFRKGRKRFYEYLVENETSFNKLENQMLRGVMLTNSLNLRS